MSSTTQAPVMTATVSIDAIDGTEKAGKLLNLMRNMLEELGFSSFDVDDCISDLNVLHAQLNQAYRRHFGDTL
jgi:hypothetical protein